MAAYTLDEIADNVGLAKASVSEFLEVCSDLEKLPKANKLSALFEDGDFNESNQWEEKFKKPIYNFWAFTKLTNGTSHFANSRDATSPRRTGNT